MSKNSTIAVAYFRTSSANRRVGSTSTGTGRGTGCIPGPRPLLSISDRRAGWRPGPVSSWARGVPVVPGPLVILSSEYLTAIGS